MGNAWFHRPSSLHFFDYQHLLTCNIHTRSTQRFPYRIRRLETPWRESAKLRGDIYAEFRPSIFMGDPQRLSIGASASFFRAVPAVKTHDLSICLMLCEYSVEDAEEALTLAEEICAFVRNGIQPE
jgi:hypothetical protein